MSDTSVSTSKAALRQQFRERVGRDAGALEAALEQLLLEADPAAIVRLREKAHALVGGLAIFGFAQASIEADDFSALLAEFPGDRQRIDRRGRALCATLRSLSAGPQI